MIDKIGKIFISYVFYYDNRTGKKLRKKRPILILALPKGMDGDYTILPISTVSRREFLDPKYDIPIDKNDYPLLQLNANISYIRTHKQTNINRSDINFSQFLGDLKNDYEDTYYQVLERYEEFSKEVLEGAL